MRYILSSRQPAPSAVLLVESGSREILERVIGPLTRSWAKGVPIHLVSCFATVPAGFPEDTRIYRVSDYRGSEGRARLYGELGRNGYSHVGIVCSGEPLMTKWKWMLAVRIPAKVFVVNENADYFWLDREHLGVIREFVLLRTGLAGAGAARTIVRMVSFPFTLLYLLMYALAVHSRRLLRRS